MGKTLDLVRLPLKAVVAVNGVGTVASKRVENGQVMVCQSITWRNRTGARGTLVLQIRSDDVVYPFANQLTPGANTWYWDPYEVRINEGEQIEASQETCIAADILDLIVLGYIVYKSEAE